MTVKELIKVLKTYPPAVEVTVVGDKEVNYALPGLPIFSVEREQPEFHTGEFPPVILMTTK